MNQEIGLIQAHNTRKSIQHYIDDAYSETSTQSGIKSFLYLVTRLAVFVVVFFALSWEIRHSALLPAISYKQSSIALELLRYLITKPLPLLSASVVVLLVIMRYRAALISWQAFEYGSQLRAFIVLLGVMSAWTYATYDFNLYYNQSHLVDRLLLLLLLVLLWWRPLFVLPFTVLLVSIINQFNFPLLGQESMWTEMNLLWQALLLFSGMFLIYLLSGSRKTTDFLFVMCCLIAASYFRSGVGKLNLDWFSFPHIHLLMLGGYASGWLSFLSPDTIASAVKFMGGLVPPMMVMALVMEWGNIFIMWRRWTTLFFLVLFPCFHIFVFLISGIFFWKWIVLEIGLLVFFYQIRRLPAPSIYTRGHFVLSLLLIGGGISLFQTSNMSWYDTRLQYNYHYEVITAGGKHYDIPGNTFAPYIHAFTFGNFPYLSKEPQLTIAYGVTVGRDIAEELLKATTPEAVFALEKKYATSGYDEFLATEFDEFIATFISNLNAHKGNPTWWKPIQPPAHLWSIPRPGEVWPDGQDSITEVLVREVTSFYDDRQFTVIRERVVRDILVPQYHSSLHFFI